MDIQSLIRERIVGNIKIGTKNEKGLPTKLSYFNVEEDKGTNTDMVDVFKKLYPNKPTNLKIRFTSENPFKFNFKRYVNGKAVCIGNGTKAITIGKDSKNRNTQIEVDCSENCEHRQCGRCKLKGSLKFVLDGIDAGGVWNLNTSGGISLSNIASEIVKYKKAGMSIVNVPFELSLTEQESLAYGTYYSIDLRRTDIKPKLTSDNENTTLPENNQIKELPETKTNKTEKKNVESKVKEKQEENKEELQEEPKQIDEITNTVEENKNKEEIDLTNVAAVTKFIPTIINGKKFTKIVLSDINGQTVEYILHPKANQEILNLGVDTIIDIKEAKLEMNQNILCKYDIKEIKGPDGTMIDYNENMELKEAV